MPTLLSDQEQDYVSLKTIYVSSQDSSAEIGPDGQADFKYTLPDYLTNVVAIEVDNYNFPISCLSQFTNRYKVDFRLRNPAIFGGNWKAFVLELPNTSVVYNTPQKQNSDLLALLFNSFNEVILRDPDFGGKVDIVPVPDPDTYVTLACRTLYYDDPFWPGYGSTECELLFGSGPNKAFSAAPIIGFDEVDIAFQPLNYFGYPLRYTSSAREAAINLYRYLDVFLDEWSPTEIFYRVFVPTINSIALTYPEVNSRARMLEIPIRQAKTLTFRLRLPDGTKPQTPQPFYLNLKVFQLKSNIAVPATQRDRAQYL